jgi:hypothetical protein
MLERDTHWYIFPCCSFISLPRPRIDLFYDIKTFFLVLDEHLGHLLSRSLVPLSGLNNEQVKSLFDSGHGFALTRSIKTCAVKLNVLRFTLLDTECDQEADLGWSPMIEN